jgi:5S rRNA maturation endonuclease (ribonuclease M5)
MDIREALASLGVTVVRESNGNLLCLCPFHDDHNPSLSVRESDGLWICFGGCGQGTWNQLTKRLGGWEETVEFSSTRSPNPRSGPAGKVPPYLTNKVPTWVLERGFSKETLREYRCGYSAYYDALVIPLLGAPALCYRVSPAWEDKVPKYRYTKGFKAHSYFYGWWNVDLTPGFLILVEGPLDLLWLRQNGYYNSLSFLGGGKLGVWQLRSVHALGVPILLAADNDKAGEETARKIASQLRLRSAGIKWAELGVTAKDVAELDPDALHMVISVSSESLKTA